MIISKGLSYGIIAGSLLLRVPQIIKILAAKSGEGISFASEVLALVSIFSSMAYGYYKDFPVSSYGDSYFLYIQGIIILSLISYYQKKYLIILVTLPAIIVATGMLYYKMVDPQIIFFMNGISVFLSVAAKLYQAFINFQNGSTGVLSPITLVLQFAGTVARIFTSIQETGDFNLILTYAVNSIANGLLVAQWIYYRNATKVTAKKAKKTQ
jgi:mannose-P-dolichol utilization defect protein 1